MISRDILLGESEISFQKYSLFKNYNQLLSAIPTDAFEALLNKTFLDKTPTVLEIEADPVFTAYFEQEIKGLYPAFLEVIDLDLLQKELAKSFLSAIGQKGSLLLAEELVFKLKVSSSAPDILRALKKTLASFKNDSERVVYLSKIKIFYKSPVHIESLLDLYLPSRKAIKLVSDTFDCKISESVYLPVSQTDQEIVSRALSLALTGTDSTGSTQDIISSFFYQGYSFKDILNQLRKAVYIDSLLISDKITVNQTIAFIRNLAKDILAGVEADNFSIKNALEKRVASELFLGRNL